METLYLKTDTDVVKDEGKNRFSRDMDLLASGSGVVLVGTVLGKISASGVLSAVQAAVAGNTGNGALTLADPAFSNPKVGVYTVTCTTGGADGASKFRVEDPDGVVVGTATGGAAFNKAVKFTIAGGGTVFVEGDAFAIAISQAGGANDGKFKPLNLAANDGTQNAAAVILQYADATSADQKVVNLKRRAQVVLQELVWPAGITNSQMKNALSQLAALGIVTRVGV